MSESENTKGVKLNENQNGSVSFATDVVATIAGLAANEVEGVAGMSSASGGGLADIWSRKSGRNFTKGVRVDVDGGKVRADINIIVEYGSPIPEVAQNIQENVKKAIETMSGLEVESVDVHVNGMSFEKENKAVAELNEQQKKMLDGMTDAESEPAAEEPSDEEETVAEEEAVQSDET